MRRARVCRLALVILATFLLAVCGPQIASAGRDPAARHTRPTPTFAPTNTPLPTATRRIFYTLTPMVPTPCCGRVLTMTPAPTRPPSLVPVATATIDRAGKSELDGRPERGAPIPWMAVITGVVLAAVPLGGMGLLALWRLGGITAALARWRAWSDPVARQRREEAARVRAIRSAAIKQEQAERRMLRQMARELADRVQDTMTRARYVHIYRPDGQKRRKFDRIRFNQAIVVGRESILLRIGRIPWGQTLYSLYEEKSSGEGPWLAKELALELGREVRMFYVEGVGNFVQIGLKHGVAGIPKLFWWRDPDNKETSAMDGNPLENGAGAMQDPDQYPETRLQINLGVTTNRRVVRADMRMLPNLIVAGVPGSGKSVFLNQTLCTWLERNTPDQLDLRLVDLKGGVEFDFFSPLVGGVVREFIDEEELVAPAMHRLVEEMKRRQQMFKGKCKNIRGWNAKHWPKLPVVVLVIDELSVVMYDRTMREATQELLKKAVALGRATGVHLVLCTQVVKVEVLPTMVTGNIPAKMIFNCAHHRTSIMVLGHGGAAGLEPNGRAVWQNGAEEWTVQAPMITDDQVRRCVEWAAQGRLGVQQQLTIEEMLLHIRDNFAWQFPPIKKLWNSCRDDFGDRCPGWDRMVQMVKISDYREQEDGPLWNLHGNGRSPYRYRVVRQGRRRVIEPVEFVWFAGRTTEAPESAGETAKAAISESVTEIEIETPEPIPAPPAPPATHWTPEDAYPDPAADPVGWLTELELDRPQDHEPEDDDDEDFDPDLHERMMKLTRSNR